MIAGVTEDRTNFILHEQDLPTSEESRVPSAGAPPHLPSVSSIINLKTEAYAGRPALSIFEGGRWESLTYRELAEAVLRVTEHLLATGIQRGDRIAILSPSRPEWGVAFFGAIRSGGTVVPLDPKLTLAELEVLVTDAEPRVVFVGSALAEVGRTLAGRRGSIEQVIVLDRGGPPDLPRLDELRGSGAVAWPAREAEETALVIYTSGTTGQPKAVMISFANLIFQVSRTESIIRVRAGDVFLSILPMNHLLELTCGFLGVLYAGGHICYAQTLYPDELVRIMRERGVSAMITVPLFLKILHRAIERDARKAGAWRAWLFASALRSGRVVPLGARRFVFAPIHRALGGRLRAFVSGGAPLERDVGEFFETIGIPVYQGYGLTETSPVVTVNRPGQNRLGSVGRPLEGVAVRVLAQVGEEGEIVTKGPHVMQGYYRRDDLTREVVDAEGWLHTGDIGRLDDDGFLYLTGRLKNVIVLPGGKKVYPEEVEEVLARSAAIKEVCVLSQRSTDGVIAGGEEVCAVVVPADALAERFRGDPAGLEAALKDEVRTRCTGLAPYKRPQALCVWPEELPKTPARKVKRGLVQEQLSGKAARR